MRSRSFPGPTSSSPGCELGRPFLVLTNNSIYTPRDLAARLRNSGLDVPKESIWTSALATARFLENQRPQGSAFVIGEAGLTTAEEAERHPFRASRIVNSIADLIGELGP